MVRIHPDPPTNRAGLGPDYGFRSPEVVDRRAKGAVAQLGERLLCKQEVIGSIPFSSTNRLCRRTHSSAFMKSQRGSRQAYVVCLWSFDQPEKYLGCSLTKWK